MTLDAQLRRFVETWEPSLAREFLRYDRLLRAKSRHTPCAWGQTGPEPYWKLLPRWIAEQGGKGRGKVRPEFLDTVVWGQTSLFYAVRLQDDLLDGDLSRSPLALAPLLFLMEADRAYASLFETNAGFWKQYRLAIQNTVAGIVRVAEMQRDPAARTDQLLQAYGLVDAIFSVGSSAVCERMGIAEMIPCVKEFVSEIGKVLLTLDDMDDMEEDLADGRLNYPARILLGSQVSTGAGLPLLAKSRHMNADAKRFDEIRKSLLACLNRASEAISPLGLQPAMDLIETTGVAIRRLRRT